MYHVCSHAKAKRDQDQKAKGGHHKGERELDYDRERIDIDGSRRGKKTATGSGTLVYKTRVSQTSLVEAYLSESVLYPETWRSFEPRFWDNLGIL